MIAVIIIYCNVYTHHYYIVICYGKWQLRFTARTQLLSLGRNGRKREKSSSSSFVKVVACIDFALNAVINYNLYNPIFHALNTYILNDEIACRSCTDHYSSGLSRSEFSTNDYAFKWPICIRYTRLSHLFRFIGRLKRKSNRKKCQRILISLKCDIGPILASSHKCIGDSNVRSFCGNTVTSYTCSTILYCFTARFQSTRRSCFVRP